MRLIPGRRSVTILAIFVGLATQGATEVRSQSASAPPDSKSGPPPQANSNQPKRSEYGVWHHFGQQQTAAAAPQPGQSGGWRHFGNPSNPESQMAVPPVRRASGLSRTRQMEQLLFDLVNRDRADPANLAETKGNAVPLKWNERLAAVARAHSIDMLSQGYFAHVDPEGKNVVGRVDAAGITWRSVGENIAISASVSGAEGAFMNEPRFAKNHRANILSSDFTEVGIGVIQGPDGRFWVTQDFCTPLSQPAAR